MLVINAEYLHAILLPWNTVTQLVQADMQSVHLSALCASDSVRLLRSCMATIFLDLCFT